MEMMREEPAGPRGSELLHSQARNPAKIPDIAGPDSIAEFQSAGADEQICKRKIDSLSGLFSTNAGGNFGGHLRYRMNGDGGLQFIQEGASAVSNLERTRAINPMADFGDARRF